MDNDFSNFIDITNEEEDGSITSFRANLLEMGKSIHSMASLLPLTAIQFQYVMAALINSMLDTGKTKLEIKDVDLSYAAGYGLVVDVIDDRTSSVEIVKKD